MTSSETERTADRKRTRHSRSVHPGVRLPIAIAGVVLAIATLFVRPGSDRGAETFEETVDRAASRLARRPADLEAFLTITGLALDRREENSRELWRDAAEGAIRLAPRLDAPKKAFIRAGFLHWYELDTDDRALVLARAGDLLRNDLNYRELWRPVLQVTRNPAFIARHAPDDPVITRQIRDLAAAWGDFATYRELDEKTREQLHGRIASMSVLELITTLSWLELSTSNLDMASLLFDELDRRSVPRVVEPRRSQVKERWSLLIAEFRAAGDQDPIPLIESPSETQMTHPMIRRLPDSWTPGDLLMRAEEIEPATPPLLLEIWVDGVLRETSTLSEARAFDLQLRRDDELLELRLANPRSRNGKSRKAVVRIEK